MMKEKIVFAFLLFVSLFLSAQELPPVVTVNDSSFTILTTISPVNVDLAPQTIPDTVAAFHLIAVKVVKVYDGDGCRAIFPDGTVRKLRFANIDAPEFKNHWVGIDSTQPGAFASRNFLRNMILNDTILIDTLPFGDRVLSYDRLIVDAFIEEPDGSGADITYLNSLIVEKGFAWSVNSKLSKRIHKGLWEDIAAAFDSSKKSKRGIWAIKGRKVSPATWRAKY